MEIRDYQKWLKEWDEARAWDRTLISHAMLHAIEELGEVSKLVQMIEGYRPPYPADPADLRELLALELSDLQIMLFKVAYLCDIDMEEAMRKGMAKVDARFPLTPDSRLEADEALARFRAYLARKNLLEATE